MRPFIWTYNLIWYISITDSQHISIISISVNVLYARGAHSVASCTAYRLPPTFHIYSKTTHEINRYENETKSVNTRLWSACIFIAGISRSLSPAEIREWKWDFSHHLGKCSHNYHSRRQYNKFISFMRRYRAPPNKFIHYFYFDIYEGHLPVENWLRLPSSASPFTQHNPSPASIALSANIYFLIFYCYLRYLFCSSATSHHVRLKYKKKKLFALWFHRIDFVQIQ